MRCPGQENEHLKKHVLYIQGWRRQYPMFSILLWKASRSSEAQAPDLSTNDQA